MKLSAHLEKRFAPSPGSAAFHLQVDFEADPGITTLFGPSGAGKSLTLDLIAGFAHPDSGRVELGGKILYDSGARVFVPPRNRQCGYVFQRDALFPHMSLRGNLMFAAQRLPRLERHRRTHEMLERFRLDEIAERRPAELSGGQRRRGSIARALIAAPKILLLDEPTNGLDAVLRDDFYSLLHDLVREFEIPVLLVTHDLDEAVTLATRMLLYNAGGIMQAGAPSPILSSPAGEEVMRAVGFINRVPAQIASLDPGRNSSRIRIEGGDIAGRYFPGYLIGDRATLITRADDLRVHSDPGLNRIPAKLEKKIEHARFLELCFAGDLKVIAPRWQADSLALSGIYFIEFPPQSLHLAAARLSGT